MLTYVAIRVLPLVWAMFGSGFGHAPRPNSHKTRANKNIASVAFRVLPVVWAMFGSGFGHAPRSNSQTLVRKSAHLCRDLGVACGLGDVWLWV